VNNSLASPDCRPLKLNSVLAALIAEAGTADFCTPRSSSHCRRDISHYCAVVLEIDGGVFVAKPAASGFI